MLEVMTDLNIIYIPRFIIILLLDNVEESFKSWMNYTFFWQVMMLTIHFNVTHIKMVNGEWEITNF